MPDLTLAQAMEWLEERPRMHTEPQLVAAGRVLAAEIRRRDGEDAKVCRCCNFYDSDREWCWLDNNPISRAGCSRCHGCSSWQKREGE